MARARNIKPGFYKNEDLAECSVWARLIFPGLWMLADREGRLEDRPKRIKGELLPYDSQEIDPLLRELEARGFIVRYKNSDGSFIQITKFAEHQTPHYTEKPSAIKPPGLQESAGHDEPDKPSALPETSGRPPPLRGGQNPLNPDSLNPDSLNHEGDSGAAPIALLPPPPAYLGDANESGIPGRARVQLAPKWELPTAWGEDAERLGFLPVEILHQSEKFRQYWVAGKGAGTRRTLKGWRQAWSNWLGNAERFRRAA